MMYLRYLSFLLDDKLYVTHKNISEIQEMVDFFEKSKNKKMLGRVYYALGRVASDYHDYSKALSFFHKALEHEAIMPDLRLKGQIYSQIGYAFLELNDFHAAMDFHKQAFSCDSLRKDTMALLFDMRDIAFLYASMEDKRNAEKVYRTVLHLVANDNRRSDIKKDVLLSLSELNLENNLDSAYCYLKKAEKLEKGFTVEMALYASGYYYAAGKDDSAKLYLDYVLADSNIYLRTDAYRTLVKIELENGNIKQASTLYDKLLDCIDSLDAKDERRDDLKKKAMFEYVYQTEKVQSLEKSNRHKFRMLEVAGIIILIMVFLLVLFWQMSAMKKLKIQNTIKEWKLRGTRDRGALLRINRQICCDTAIGSAINMQRHLSDEEWEKVYSAVDSSYPEFCKNLKSCVSLSEQEWHVCLLVKLGIGTSKISFLTSRASSTISTTKQRIYRKITKEKGSAEQFDELLNLM